MHVPPLGFLLSVPDNGSFMFLEDGTSPPRCRGCRYVRDHEWIHPRFATRVGRHDVTETLDGYLIVSERFRTFGASFGLRTRPLPAMRGYFAAYVDETAAFDSDRRRTRFENRCDVCGEYESIVGATPVFLRAGAPLPDRFVRSDLQFGTGDERHPVFMTGAGLATLLREQSFDGIDLEPISS